MYRIMLVNSKRDNYESLYKFMTSTTSTASGTSISPLEFETKEALDAQIDKMLNNDGYAKADFIVVTVIDYTVDAKDYSDDEAEPAATETTDTTEPSGTTEG